MTPTPVIRLDAARKTRRARRVRPLARRMLVSVLIGISIVGSLVLVGVIAKALTPKSALGLAVTLIVCSAAGWPMSEWVLARVRKSPQGPARGNTTAGNARAQRKPRMHPQMVPNPAHPSARDFDDRPRNRS